jgi:hypothetical protein
VVLVIVIHEQSVHTLCSVTRHLKTVLQSTVRPHANRCGMERCINSKRVYWSLLFYGIGTCFGLNVSHLQSICKIKCSAQPLYVGNLNLSRRFWHIPTQKILMEYRPTVCQPQDWSPQTVQNAVCPLNTVTVTWRNSIQETNVLNIKYSYMTSVRCNMFRRSAAIFTEVHQYLKRSELWYSM